jgi:RNA polymerase sigma-70 factor (ECF subfamily)
MSTLRTAVSNRLWGGALRDQSGEDEEGRLLAELAAGDRSAAERLVERTYHGVYALLRRLSGDAELAADLTQETYRKAWASLAGFDRRAKFSTWLFRIAYTTFLNHLRRPRRLVPLEEKHEATLEDAAPAADEVMGRDVQGEQLRRAVLALPEDLRRTVTASFWGELAVKEVAREEGVTPVAIRKRLKKALRMLALTLEEVAR